MTRRRIPFPLLLLISAMLLIAPARAAEEDKGLIAGLISRALSSRTTQVSIGAVDGALSSDVTVSQIVLSDRDGPWLKIDKARLVWSRAALFGRRLEVDRLEIGVLDYLRPPLKSPPDPKAVASDLALPDLPLKVIIKQFAIGQVSLGEPVLGAAARLAVAGDATLGPPSEGLDLRLEAHRLDAAGTFAARLGYVPQTTKLSLSLDVDEPAGGLIAHAANIPGQPPVKLTWDGEGPLDAFHADLNLTAGPDIGAKGAVDLTRQGAGRRLGTDLRARVAGLSPTMFAEAFAGETDLQGNVFFGDDGAIEISSLGLITPSAHVYVVGGVKADGQIDTTIHAASLPGAKAIGKLDFYARLNGALAALQANVDLEVENLHFSLGDVAKLTATFSARANGPLGQSTTQIAIAGDASFSGLSLIDPAKQDIFGREGRVALRADASRDGMIQVSDFHLEGASVKAAFSGEVGRKRIHGEGRLEAPDLSRFAKASGRALRGEATVKLALDGAPDQDAFGAVIDGQASHLATGIQAVDGFMAGTLALKGGVRLLGGGGFGFDHLALAGRHGVAQIDGTADAGKAAFHAEIAVPEAKYLDPRVAGRATIVADLSGSLAHLDAAAKAELRDGRLLDRPAPRLDVALVAHDLLGRPDAAVTLSGEIDAKPATGSLSVAKTAEGGWRLDGLALALGSARLEGALELSRGLLADGRLALSAANLDDLSPLALTRLSGGFKGEAKLKTDAGRQNASLVANSAAASVAGLSVANLAVNLAAADIYGHAVVEGEASATRIVAGGETFADLRIACKGDAAASDFDAKATARGFAITTRGRFAMDPARLQLSALTAQGKGQTLTLAKPANFDWGPGGLTVDQLAVGVGGGRLALSGSVGPRLNLRVTATSLPLALANLASPGLDLDGRLAGEATIGGDAGAPEGDWRVTIDGLTAPATRSFALDPLRIVGAGRLAGGRTTLEATVTAPAAGTLHVSGSAPIRVDDALDIRATGRFDLAVANRWLSVHGQRASGAAVLDARIVGALAKPNAQGSLTISNAGFADEVRGLKIESIEATVVAHGDEIAIERFHATTPHGGTLGLDGRVRLDADAGFPGELHLSGQRAQLVETNVVTASADLSLKLSGALAREPQVSGRIDVKSLDIGIPSNLSGALRPLDNARHIDPGPTARARFAIDARALAAAKAGPPFRANLALQISAPSRVFLRGRGVDAEFGGELDLNGSSSSPQVKGGFDLRRGTLNLLGGQLVFTRGRVQFLGDVTPELDLTAQMTTTDITAYVNITGSAAKPEFAFTSSPTLPQDEILSRILFQKASGSLSPFQALELANAASALSGNGDAFEKLRKTLGVDSFDVTTGASGGPVVGAQKAINERLSLGVKSGARPEDNGVSLNFDVTRHLRLQGGVDASGGSTGGVGVQWEY